MAYVKNIWVDQDVERPKTYEVTNNQDGSITLTDSFGLVTELGTPVNEVNMNHIEDGIDGCAIRKHNLTETFNLGEWVLGGTGDDEGIYKSLIANNVGNAITDDTKWEKVEFSDTIHLHALKSYEDAGELLTDSEGLADVKKYAHSTFDLAKFTNEGTTITDNGIASGFASGNSLLVTDVFNPQNTWEIRGSFVTPASVAGNQTIITTTVTYGTRVRLYTNYKIGFMASSNNSSYDIAGDGFTGTNALQASTKYYFRFQFTGTQYILSTSLDSITWTQQCVKDSTSKIYTTTTTQLRFGKAGGQYEIFGGSIDLKDFEVHEDGIPVINGNKTGIDTIKPDDYTVVGTPTISADGVASGFSANENLYKTSAITISNTGIFDIKARVYVPSSASNQNVYFNIGDGSSLFKDIILRYNYEASKISLVINNGTNGSIVIQDATTTTGWHNIEFGYNGTEYYWNIDGIQVYSLTSSTKYLAGTYNVYIGNRGSALSTNYLSAGSIDLNAFKIYVDGNLVYQPCLKIPYTLSKTGSKIVDSVYRDRVNDMYSQFGYAPYYTLSVTDFTLPQGEIYGLMQKNALNGMMPDYANGIEITNALPYTVVDNGYVNIYLKTTAVNQTISVTRNNVSTIVAEKYNYANVYSSGDSNMIPVGPGDIIDSSTTTMTDAVITYFPLLGGI